MFDWPWLDRLREEGLLDLYRCQLARDLQEMGHLNREAMFWVVSLMLANSSGSLCVPVLPATRSRLEQVLQGALPGPDLKDWMEEYSSFDMLQFGSLLAEHGSKDSAVPFVPLILKDGFLFFQAHFYYRQKFLESYHRRSAARAELISQTNLLNGLNSLLRGNAPPTVEQAYAVLLAGLLPLVLVTGGPGSGKTSTIYAILKVALESEVDPKEIRIAAPTGRAASRVLESLQQRASEDPGLWQSMQQVQSSTIHRLLGAGENGFYHNAELPVPARLLVVDELSMVDVTLMGRLLEAVDPENTTLVLLGDPDQLPSVEAGAVLQDFLRIRTDSGPPQIDQVYSSLQAGHGRFPDRSSLQSGPAFSVFLKGSHRFGGSLMEFSSDLREGRVSEYSLQSRKGFAKTGDDLFQGEGVVYIDSAEMELVELLKQWMEIQDEDQFGDDMDLNTAFANLNRTRILSPVRKGPAGVELVNRICGRILKEKFAPYGYEDWFAGMPFLLHRNDNVRRIYNGDTGIVGPGRDLLAYFGTQQSQDQLSLRAFQRDSLPENEPAFCHTIHKSQGSEYEVVLVLLSGLEGNRAPLNRELIYTAVTRARRKCILYGNAREIAEASERRIIRETGLAMANGPQGADG